MSQVFIMPFSTQGYCGHPKAPIPTDKAVLQSSMPKGPSQPEKHGGPDPRVLGTRNSHSSNSTIMFGSESSKDFKNSGQK